MRKILFLILTSLFFSQGVDAFETDLSLMFIRSTNNKGKGAWANVLNDNGPQAIRGELSGNILSSNSLSDNTLKTVLSKLLEGNNEGERTYLQPMVFLWIK